MFIRSSSARYLSGPTTLWDWEEAESWELCQKWLCSASGFRKSILPSEWTPWPHERIAVHYRTIMGRFVLIVLLLRLVKEVYYSTMHFFWFIPLALKAQWWSNYKNPIVLPRSWDGVRMLHMMWDEIIQDRRTDGKKLHGKGNMRKYLSMWRILGLLCLVFWWVSSNDATDDCSP